MSTYTATAKCELSSEMKGFVTNLYRLARKAYITSMFVTLDPDLDSSVTGVELFDKNNECRDARDTVQFGDLASYVEDNKALFREAVFSGALTSEKVFDKGNEYDVNLTRSN